MKNEEMKINDINLVTTVIYMSSLVVALLLIYNEKLRLSNKQPIYNRQEEYNINLITRIVVLGTTLAFLYADYKNYERAPNPMRKYFNTLEVIASWLFVIAAIILLYIAITDRGQGRAIIETETPEA